MSNSLLIFFKATGERFNVPCQSQTTIIDLIKYVCSQSIVSLTTNSEDYYMAINNGDILENDKTVEETGLNPPKRFVSLNVLIKTRVLMKRISESRMQFWQVSDKEMLQNAKTMTEKEKSVNTDKPSSAASQQKALTPTATISNDGDINSEVHILVCGGPKVGKSTLINALCGCPVAKANEIGLDRCTQRTTYYQLDNIYFWDTPGIEQWSNLDIDSYLHSSPRRQTPLCMFYCASPGSFTKLKQLHLLLDECISQRHIFCALVVTNMFANVNRHAILNDFKALLSKYVDHSQQIREEHGVWYYGHVGLCTMVNSQEYINDDTNRLQLQQGINELVIALIKSLSGTLQLDSWLQTIEKNRQFWLDKQEELYRLTEKNPNEICLSEIIQMI